MSYDLHNECILLHHLVLADNGRKGYEHTLRHFIAKYNIKHNYEIIRKIIIIIKMNMK